MTVEEALPWLQEHKDEPLQRIWEGEYKPSLVRRKGIPKLEGSEMQPLVEPLFLDGSYG